MCFFRVMGKCKWNRQISEFGPPYKSKMAPFEMIQNVIYKLITYFSNNKKCSKFNIIHSKYQNIRIFPKICGSSESSNLIGTIFIILLVFWPLNDNFWCYFVFLYGGKVHRNDHPKIWSQWWQNTLLKYSNLIRDEY